MGGMGLGWDIGICLGRFAGSTALWAKPEQQEILGHWEEFKHLKTGIMGKLVLPAANLPGMLGKDTNREGNIGRSLSRDGDVRIWASGRCLGIPGLDLLATEGQ